MLLPYREIAKCNMSVEGVVAGSKVPSTRHRSKKTASNIDGGPLAMPVIAFQSGRPRTDALRQKRVRVMAQGQGVGRGRLDLISTPPIICTLDENTFIFYLASNRARLHSVAFDSPTSDSSSTIQLISNEDCLTGNGNSNYRPGSIWSSDRDSGR